jgi:hypothetical protein
MTTERALAVGLGAALALVACGASNEEVGATSTTAARAPVSTDSADEIATARCEREVRCGDVGPGLRYETREQCFNTLRVVETSDLAPARCPQGVTREGVDRCLADVRGQRCDNIMENLDWANDCTRSALCKP